MQKLTLSVSILLLIASGYLLYEKNKLSDELNTLKSEGCNSCSSISKPLHFAGLDIRMLDTISYLYKANMKTYVDGFNKKQVEDSRAVWFDLTKIKNFIREIETQLCNKNCGNEKPNLGIRIYYARYPATGSNSSFRDLSNLPDSFQNLHTVFMIPTFDSSGYHIDFDPSQVNKQGCPYVRLNTEVPPPPAIKRILALALPGNYTAQNHGDLCPPVCSPGTAF